MTDFKSVEAPAPPGGRVFCAESLGRSLLEASVRATQGLGCRSLDRMPMLGRRPGVRDDLRARVLASDALVEALPVDQVARLDAGAVAEWIIGRYRAAAYPAAVLGSPHGSAAHLAAAMGAAWLPSGFTVSVPWPGGEIGDWEGAAGWGAALAERILDANPGVTVRQVHDPLQRGPLCATTVTLHVRWARVPEAYREFLRSRIAPDGAALLFRDLRNWPVRELSERHSFQLGSPVSGWEPPDYTLGNPSFQRSLAVLGESRWADPDPGLPGRYAEFSGEPGFDHDLGGCGVASYRVLYPRPGVLSAFVADLYRRWLRADDRPDGHCVVGSGALLDPWQVYASGLVPYWCEAATRRCVEGAEWWLAGSEPFDAVSVLPQPPGVLSDAHAVAGQWRSIAAFARRRPHVDRLAMSRYPLLPMSAAHAASALSTVPPVAAPPPRMRAGDVVRALRAAGPPLGLLVA